MSVNYMYMATIPSCSDGDLPASDQTTLPTVILTESNIPGGSNGQYRLSPFTK